MKLGILGGTFDPIHRAHIALGREACRIFHLDALIVMPTGNSYLKTFSGNVTSARHRMAMVKLAIAEEPEMSASDLEINRPGYTYTADTLLRLRRLHPEAELYFIVGADSLHDMDDWFAPEVIFHNAVILAAYREELVSPAALQKTKEYLCRRYEANICLFPFDGRSISSRQIRREIREGKLPHPALTAPVNDYIRENGLYTPPCSEEAILQRLQKKLSPSRFRHTLGVADTARKLAAHYGVDPDKAYLAGILHDCGKNEGTALTHGPIGAVIAREEYGITDEEILLAIRYHTTGRPAMTELEKIIFVADYIEPGRDRAPRLEQLRKLAFYDINETIRCILADTLDYLRKSDRAIDGQSVKTYNYYDTKRNIS